MSLLKDLNIQENKGHFPGEISGDIQRAVAKSQLEQTPKFSTPDSEGWFKLLNSSLGADERSDEGASRKGAIVAILKKHGFETKWDSATVKARKKVKEDIAEPKKSLIKELNGRNVQSILKKSDASDAGASDVIDKAKANSDVSFSLMRNTINADGKVSGSDVANYIERAEELNDEVDTVPFGLETDDGQIVKVYVNVEQADKFEEAMKNMLGMEDDIEQAINRLTTEFDIVDVVWPRGEDDEEGEPDPDADLSIDDTSMLDDDPEDDEDFADDNYDVVAKVDDDETKQEKDSEEEEDDDITAAGESDDDEELDDDGKPKKKKKKKKAQPAEPVDDEVKESLSEAFAMDDIAIGGTVIYKMVGKKGYAMSKVRSKREPFSLRLENGSTVENRSVVSTDASDWKDYKEKVSEAKRDHLTDSPSTAAAMKAMTSKGLHIKAMAEGPNNTVYIEADNGDEYVMRGDKRLSKEKHGKTLTSYKKSKASIEETEQEKNMTLGSKFLERILAEAAPKEDKDGVKDGMNIPLDSQQRALVSKMKLPFAKRLVAFYAMVGIPGRYLNTDEVENGLASATDMLRKQVQVRRAFQAFYNALATAKGFAPQATADDIKEGKITEASTQKRGGAIQKLLETVSVKLGLPESFITTSGPSAVGTALLRTAKLIEESSDLEQALRLLAIRMGIKPSDAMKPIGEARAAKLPKDKSVPIEVRGVKGMKSTPWSKKFKDQAAMEKWMDAHGDDIKVHAYSTDRVNEEAASILGEAADLGNTAYAKAVATLIESFGIPDTVFDGNRSMTARRALIEKSRTLRNRTQIIAMIGRVQGLLNSSTGPAGQQPADDEDQAGGAQKTQGTR